MSAAGDDGTISWRDLLAEAAGRLRVGAGAEGSDPAADARVIVEEASGASAGELRFVLDDPATERAVARFDAMVARRAAGEPLQYVIGHWPFRSLDLMVDRRVLIPRPETEQVVEVALTELDRLGGRERSTRVVDLGTGSGAIALAIATERVRTEVWATDASAGAVAVARANLAGVGRAAARVTITEGDWFAALPEDLRGTLDMVVSNPPYVATGAALDASVLEWEPATALFSGVDGLDDLRRIIAGAGKWLDTHGVLVCELSPEQADAAVALVQDSGDFTESVVEPDLAGRQRTLVARR